MSSDSKNHKISLYRLIKLKIMCWVFKIKDYFSKDPKGDLYDGLW
jgi:hypothetical protein